MQLAKSKTTNDIKAFKALIYNHTNNRNKEGV